jgi:RHS repeat-associated protein
LYSYDSLNQLASFQRGELNTGKTGLEGSASRSQNWEMDALGNFTSVTTDETEQDRTANAQNQITSIDGLTTPEYDSNGNMILDQNGNTLVYDAWNRLVGYLDGETTLQSYQYDGLNRRIVEDPGTATDLFYSSSWQVMEKQQSGVATLQYVWSPVYVDAMVLRDQLYSNSTLQERLYVQQDANYNVSGLVSSSGSVVERYVYDPYGTVTVLSAGWVTQEGSSYDWFYLFQGGRFDGIVGLYNFRDREYNPITANWTILDPSGFAAEDTNLYRFVGDGPTCNVDPSGHMPYTPVAPQPRFDDDPSDWRVEKLTFFSGSVMRALHFQQTQGGLFGENTHEYTMYRQGCVGLNALRLNVPRGNVATTLPGTRAFDSLPAALKAQKEMQKEYHSSYRIVLWAIQHACYQAKVDRVMNGKTGPEYTQPKNAWKIRGVQLAPGVDPQNACWDFATAAQKPNGDIIYWEDME